MTMHHQDGFSFTFVAPVHILAMDSQGSVTSASKLLKSWGTFLLLALRRLIVFNHDDVILHAKAIWIEIDVVVVLPSLIILF
jgi:hypothetical protein